MRNTHKRRQPRAGFTLIELLMVLAIIVILAGLAGTRMLGSQKKAYISSTKAQIGMFKSTLERYALDMNTFPTTEEGLIVLVEEPSEGDSTTKWDGPYLDAAEVPKDPWGNDYQYEYPPSHGEGKLDFPDIWSYGPDGEDGTDDDVVNWVKEEEMEGD